MGSVYCWQDSFVYYQCCDTRTYGPSGFRLCFGHPSVSFERCCPPPMDFAPHHIVDVHPSWWHGRHLGCNSHFHWLPTAVAMSLLGGHFYDPHTGEVLKEPVLDDSASPASEETRRLELERLLAASRDFSFLTFVKGALQYYIDGFLSLEVLQMMHEGVAIFGDTLQECPPVAIIAGLMKAEQLLPRDRAVALSLARDLRTLLGRVVRRTRLGLLARRVIHRSLQRVSANQTGVPRKAKVDLVVPLCATAELHQLAGSLGAAIGELPEFIGSGDGRSSAPLPPRVELRLWLYDVCGLLRVPPEGGPLPADLSAAVFAGLPASASQLFGAAAGRLPAVQVVPVEEEVPTGDVAAYLEHLAGASEAGTLADATMLLHPDFREHVRQATLDMVFGGMVSGSWPYGAVDFLPMGWRHEGPTRADGQRVASHLRYHCDVDLESKRVGPCDGSPPHPLLAGARFSDYNPELLKNLWRLAFGRPLDPRVDDLGAYDFSQLLVSRRAITARPASYWRGLSRAVSARASYQLLPGTRFISQRVDLSPNYRFNKGVCIWFEHMWHLFLDPRFFPDSCGRCDGPAEQKRDLRAFTRLSDPSLPLGLRMGPDSVMMRHYWLTAEEQCAVLRDTHGCNLLRLEQGFQRSSLVPAKWLSGRPQRGSGHGGSAGLADSRRALGAGRQRAEWLADIS